MAPRKRGTSTDGTTTSGPAEVVEIPRLTTGTTTLYLWGTRPIILNRLSEKARHELLSPSGRKTAATRASSLKHDPLQEFQAAPHRIADPDAETLLGIPGSAVKGALMTAALDLPGAKKAQIGRLVWVEGGELLPVYGVPKLLMSVVRSADMARTPDIRTRVIVPNWCVPVDVTYVLPLIRPEALHNLAYAAGLTVGIGDYRQEKGKGSYGAFEVITDGEDERLVNLMADDMRAQQLVGMDKHEAYDQDTKDLLEWWMSDARTQALRSAIGRVAEAQGAPRGRRSVVGNGAAFREVPAGALANALEPEDA
jgi:hypothetical protein